MIGQTRVRGDRRKIDPGPFGKLLGLMLGNFSLFLRMLRPALRFSGATSFEVAFWSDLFRFFIDVGWILEGFLGDYSTIFRAILENGDFVKTVVFLSENNDFYRFEL